MFAVGDVQLKRPGQELMVHSKVAALHHQNRALPDFRSHSRTGRAGDDKGQLGQAVEALELQVRGPSQVGESVIYDVLRRCTAHKDLVLGARVHSLVVASGHESNSFLANHIICMYASHGKLEEANHVFAKVPVPSLHMWASIILAHARQGRPNDAITLYKQMRQSRLMPNDHVFVAALKACANAKDLSAGREVHADILRVGASARNVFVGTCLVDMYSRCGSLHDAREVFNALPTKDVVTWNVIITACAQHGLGKDALDLYAAMQHEGKTVVNNVTFVCLLRACASSGFLHEGKQLHAQIAERGLQADLVVGTCLVDVYVKCGSMEDARKVFDGLPKRDVVIWTAMIAGYARHGPAQQAFALYESMQREGIYPTDAVLFVCLLKACASIGSLRHGKQLHAHVLERGLKADVSVTNCLISMYAKCGALGEARVVFDTSPKRDVVTWNAMIAGYVQQGHCQEALALYANMRQEGLVLPNAVTFSCLLEACGNLRALPMGKQLHAEIKESRLESDVVVGTCLVDMYAKCGGLDDARRVFDRLTTKDVVTWTAMVAGYAQHGLGREALDLYAIMQQQGITAANHVTFVCLLQACAIVKSIDQGEELHAQICERGLDKDVVIGTGLVDMYAKCGRFDDARRVFDDLPARDLATWNAMIAGYVQQDFFHEALSTYSRMQLEGKVAADAVTFLCLLQACGGVAALEKGKEIHALISKTGLQASDLYVANSLIDMYGKCGSMRDAQDVFDGLCTRDCATWNSLIAGYARQGQGRQVFHLFDKMKQEGIQPNGLSFLSVLTACSHVGHVDMAQQYFEDMTGGYGIIPSMEHYSCMIDLLGRAGHLYRAMEMAQTMPWDPDAVVWRCLLGACQKWRNVELGRQAFDHAVRLENKDAAAYVLMSNIYSAAQKKEEAKEIQGMRMQVCAWKKPGQSWWTDLQGVVHTFTAGHKAHLEWQGIDAKLKELVARMKKEGYVPHLGSVLRDMPDDEKEAALCGHSEKLAIAYALQKTPPGTTIRVVKNLRVCEDCHTATALISKIEQRTIVCRDASRFHVYKDGLCSCGNYW